MKYHQRLTLFILIDTLIILIVLLASRTMIVTNNPISTDEVVITSLTLLIGHHIFAYIFSLNKKSWEYASIGELIIVLKTATATMIITAIVQLFLLKALDIRLLIAT